jgi:hypothetical protein
MILFHSSSTHLKKKKNNNNCKDERLNRTVTNQIKLKYRHTFNLIFQNDIDLRLKKLLLCGCFGFFFKRSVVTHTQGQKLRNNKQSSKIKIKKSAEGMGRRKVAHFRHHAHTAKTLPRG